MTAATETAAMTTRKHKSRLSFTCGRANQLILELKTITLNCCQWHLDGKFFRIQFQNAFEINCSTNYNGICNCFDLSHLIIKLHHSHSQFQLQIQLKLFLFSLASFWLFSFSFSCAKCVYVKKCNLWHNWLVYSGFSPNVIDKIVPACVYRMCVFTHILLRIVLSNIRVYFHAFGCARVCVSVHSYCTVLWEHARLWRMRHKFECRTIERDNSM